MSCSVGKAPASVAFEGGKPSRHRRARLRSEGARRPSVEKAQRRRWPSLAVGNHPSPHCQSSLARYLEMRKCAQNPRGKGEQREQTFKIVLQLPFRAQWDSWQLRPGKYEIAFLDEFPAPAVVIHGMGVAAMLIAAHVRAIEGTQLSTLFLMPGAPAPRVQLLRLAAAHVDLYFSETHDGSPTILALPLHESGV
jgi:hypothetical protein